MGFRGVRNLWCGTLILSLTPPLQPPTRRELSCMGTPCLCVFVFIGKQGGGEGETQKARSQLWKHRGDGGG